MSADEWVVVRLKVQDRNKFIRDMRASGTSVRDMGREVEKTGGLFSQGAHHGFLWNQMLFTIRRTLYFATLGVAGLGAAVVATGFKFDSMLEQQRLAFRFFTGSVQGANKEVDYLFNLAAKGPFNFSQVIAASRQLMAFGMSTQRANTVLVNLQDAVAGMGLSQDALDRATLALGQIQSSGRLLGQDLRQLEQLGLVNPQDFARRLHIDPRAMANIGQLSVPSKVAIDAIMAYWQSRFKGASKQFQMTFLGQWNTIVDYASQTFGEMAQPLFVYMRDKIFPTMQTLTQQVGLAFKPGGGGFGAAFKDIDKAVGHGLNLAGAFSAITFAAKPALAIIKLFVLDIVGALRFLHVGGAAFYALGGALRAISDILHVLNPVLKVLILLWIADRAAVLAVNLATRSKLALDGLQLVLTKRQVFWQGIMTAARGKDAAGLVGVVKRWRTWATAERDVWDASRRVYTQGKVNNGMFAKLSRLMFTTVIPAITGVAVATWGAVGATWAWFASLTAIQTFTVVGAILTLIAALALLIIKFQAVKDWLRKNSAIFRLLNWSQRSGGGGKFQGGGILGNWLASKGAPGWVNFLTGSHKVKGMATGGRTLTHGLAMVGEGGPELLSLPRGASVAPLGREVPGMGGLLAALSGATIEVHSHTYLDKRQIAETVTEYQLDKKARL